MSLEFEWNAKKAEANQAIHGIDFEEALTVFRDPLARIFEDEEHSGDEPREIMIGHSVKQRLTLVCFTVRRARVRTISARKATRLERRDYEENVLP
ncbi:MAG: BrnT family toxin [Acidobacteriia bacterium]|nr:BrnT family toxin [Terriglobia bacterium]